MTGRIAKLCERTLAGEMYAAYQKTAYDEADLALPESERDVKRLCEFLLNQEPVLTEYQTMTGFFNCDGTVVGDAFRRRGHRSFSALCEKHYLKAVENLSVFEWQHAVADYEKVLEKGIEGIVAEIDASLAQHTGAQEIAFLQGLRRVALTLIAWTEKCAARAADLAKTVENGAHRANLEKLSATLMRVPRRAPESFYEAVLTVYLSFAADPDSMGTLDRYLSRFYFADIEKGVLTREQAKEYLQELFLMVQAATKKSSRNFTRGGESHFCVGGYLANGEDAFTDLSRLIVEALIELPTYVPQVTLRWTAKTPREVFRFVMDMERRDPHKRIAFQNDEKRVKCYTELCGFPLEVAVRYTTVGCNEPAFLGTVTGATTKINLLRCVETLFHQKAERVLQAENYEAFYKLFLEELFADLSRAFAWDDHYNRERAKDVNYLSSLFFQGCIEKAKSCTQGAGDYAICSPACMGIPNVIDSLCVVKQFVFDEKLVTMAELIAALQANWRGYEDLHTLICKRGDFFGNDTPRSNAVAQALYRDLYVFLKGKKNLFGYQYLMGDLTGYNEHFKWFGENMAATPDGRYAGEAMKFGLGQSGGHDRKGLSALLNSVAGIDPDGIGCGETVTNLMIDEQLIKDDASFEKLSDMLETYFKNGGVHFQLTYVSREDLLAAKEKPLDYQNLRVRVSGFSDYFVNLKEGLQDDIIARTSYKD